ncbi:xanthine dehydrogenase molybdopterin binding subunit [Malikia sp.]|uniref:xanthine dehydrogenase molybdopterin binding subunit n=1 Tax=Malikia sp. TaxID=2070706 RepID=UPI0026256B40|nr:xanthine dehydrogenase molybdopterin binding subunit [Malikia sp.]MDD2729022.1 xanthine dehydrogenase molybdopterin binding subunit [Malikia sp.]
MNATPAARPDRPPPPGSNTGAPQDRPSASARGQPLPHESARAHVTGEAAYVDDLPELAGTLHAAPILSPLAHGRLLGLDAAAALALPGMVGLVLVADIPGDAMLAAQVRDEPVLALDELHYAGQVIGLAVATDRETARRAARRVQVLAEPLPALLSARAAHAAGQYVTPPVRLARGDAQAALARAPHRLRGSFETGAQEHLYLEGQVAYALPQEQGQWLVQASTQHPGEVQHWIASALGLASHAVQVVCRRMGGGFGGKETQAGQIAVWAALAAHKFARPVKLRLDRDDDFLITGKRHAFTFDWEAGFDDSGRLLALDLTQLADCGFSADLSGPICDRAVFHSDNAYFLENVAIHSWRCRTHRQSSTAFRGFGGPQGVLAIETILGEVARHLRLDPLDVRLANLYSLQERNVTPYGMTVEDNILAPLIGRLTASARYRERRAAITAWNAASPVIKRGLALTPVKFGISFTATLLNQAGALVHVYTDGSVLLNHGGTEMGQGLHTKVAQIVADELGVPFEWVRVSASDTARVPNASATAASTGTDLNGRAAQYAARQIRVNLATFIAGLDSCGAGAVRFAGGRVESPKATRAWAEVVAQAYANRIPLWSDGFYRTPKIHYDKDTLTGRPFHYFAYGAACTEIALDTLTGEQRLLAVDILHDVGRSLNPALDIGQIEGGFIQGLGWLTSEQLVWDDAGRLLTHGPGSYKIPTAGDLPAHFRVELWPEPNREDNVFGSKAVGEPPLLLAASVWEALRDAVAQARGDGLPVRLDAPATPERLLRALGGLDGISPRAPARPASPE